MDSKAYLSPDGKNIVFYSKRNTYNPNTAGIEYEIWAMERDGSNQRLLFGINDIDEGSDIVFLKWSAQSDYITLFTKNYGRSSIWEVYLEGEKTKTHSFGFRIEKAIFSPDGEKIAFVNWESNKFYSANSNDLSDITLIDTGFVFDFDWVYDSETLVYSKFDPTIENYDLWQAKTDGTYKRKLMETPGNEYDVVCSKLNYQIAYEEQNDVYVTPIDVFVPKKIEENAGVRQWVNNKDLLLLSKDQGSENHYWSESWIVAPEGNVIRRIEEGNYSQVEFSNDGDYYLFTVFDSEPERGGNIWLDRLP